MKTIICIVLVFSLSFALAGCFSGNDDGDKSTPENTVAFTLDTHSFEFTTGGKDGYTAPYSCYYTSGYPDTTLVAAALPEDTSVSLYFFFSGNKTGSFTADNFHVSMFQNFKFDLIISKPVTITVSEYGKEGEQVRGEFSGVLKGSDNVEYPIQGSFSVTRLADDSYSL